MVISILFTSMLPLLQPKQWNPLNLYAQENLYAYLVGTTWPVAFKEFMSHLPDFFPPENIN